MSHIKNITAVGIFGIILLGAFACRQATQPKRLDQKQYEIEDGFHINCIASEPLIEAPVALDWDIHGRMWVIEMIGYMPNLDGTCEEVPNGRISILEDQDGNGLMDHKITFLDGLVLPRALLLTCGGLLYCEPPFLYFIEIENDQPGKKIIVDSTYAIGGNVEHLANGLMMNLDNWIYSAKSNVRYKKLNGKWLKEFTAFRGQWGITRDDEGRLLYNDNSNQLQGEYTLPNAALHNVYLKPKNVINRQINRDQKVYPLRATAVNRGYQDGVLDSNKKLRKFTSACGPVIYRGGAWPDAYKGNSFVCGPEANLVKRNVHVRQGLKITARQAYENREFLASWDSGFRPVNLFNGPDGSMYVIDMHRGIIQHKSYMTSYLRDQIIQQRLDSILGMGRILRIDHNDQIVFEKPIFDQLDIDGLLNLFHHPNGWVRDKAQQLLVHQQPNIPSEKCIGFIKETNQDIPLLHFMWTLEGKGQLDLVMLKQLMEKELPVVQGQAFYLSASMFGDIESNQVKQHIEKLILQNQTDIDVYLANGLGMFSSLSDSLIFHTLEKLAVRNNDDIILAEMAMSGLGNRVQSFQQFLLQSNSKLTNWTSICNQVVQNQKQNIPNKDLTSPAIMKEYATIGFNHYQSICATCHGPGGEGLDHLAPSLVESEIVKGPPEKFTLLVLHGYKTERSDSNGDAVFNAAMPGIGVNETMSDSEIAGLLNFVRNAFATAPQTVTPAMIKNGRNQQPGEGILNQESLNHSYLKMKGKYLQ
jgi:mono/diheme cytochrome c family protein